MKISDAKLMEARELLHREGVPADDVPDHIIGATINLDEFKQAYDWRAAFHEAVRGFCRDWGADDRNEEHPIDNVTAVYAASEGENDERDWIAVVGWSGEGGKFAVMRAGCDYTGWDCQAGGNIEYHDTLQAAVSKLTLTEEERQRLGADIRRLLIPTDW